MTSSLLDQKVTSLLDSLYADATENDPRVHQSARKAGANHDDERAFYRAVRLAYMAIGPAFGSQLYTLARALKAKTIVEFGTSFGISTIFLAAAIRDNGAGKVITTEFEAEKVERARENLTKADLVDCVEFRLGDAVTTLKSDLPPNIDLILLDGAKGMYLDVLKTLEPSLRTGGIVAGDNTDHDGMEVYLEYMRKPDNGYISWPILGEANEISIRC